MGLLSTGKPGVFPCALTVCRAKLGSIPGTDERCRQLGLWVEFWRAVQAGSRGRPVQTPGGGSAPPWFPEAHGQ
eukprot:11168647-Lingulodinium_polyedra.AAC.1